VKPRVSSAIDTSWIPPMVKIRDYVAGHSFDDPADFIRILRPRSGLWDPEPRRWIFRGLSNADWYLWPSAHRPEPWLQFRPHTTIPLIPSAMTELERLEREVAMVREFYEAANASGLGLPTRPFLEREWRMALMMDWPSPDFLPLVALAQHHRVPTRLLDWTRRGVVAAYFAAQEPADGSSSANMCVWALNREFIEEYGKQDGFECDVGIASAPHASNPNLHAQSGLFTFNNYGKGTTDLRAVEHVVSELARRVDDKLGGVPVMRKLTLSRAHAHTVLRDLDLEDVSARTLFPDFAGVVDYLRYRKPCP
jgi:hypothetical protein